MTANQLTRQEIVEKLSKFPDPALLRARRKKEAQEKYKKLLEEINLSDQARQDGYKME